MTVSDVKKDIIAKNFRQLYIFFGDEQKVQNIYVHKIAEVGECELQYIDSVTEIYKQSANSLFATRKCFVCLNDAEFAKAEKSTVEKITGALNNNILICQFTKLDKRCKLYNGMKESFVEFEYLHPVVLEKHIKEVADVLPPTAEKLIDVCEQDYGRILLELDKINLYDKEHPDKAFNELLKSGAIYEPPGDKIFEFVDSVLAGKPKLAFRLLQDCKAIGEPSLRLLLVLFTNIKHLLQVQACERDIAGTTGLTSWEIRNVQKHQNVYRNSELVHAMEIIRQTEMGIKMGKIDEQIAVDYVLVNIF